MIEYLVEEKMPQVRAENDRSNTYNQSIPNAFTKQYEIIQNLETEYRLKNPINDSEKFSGEMPFYSQYQHINSLTQRQTSKMPKKAIFYWSKADKNFSDRNEVFLNKKQMEEAKRRDNYINALETFEEKFPEWSIDFFVDDLQKISTEVSFSKLKNTNVLRISKVFDVIESSIKNPEIYKVTEYIDAMKNLVPAGAKDAFLLYPFLVGELLSPAGMVENPRL